MILLLLTLTLGVAEAGSLFYEVQQPPTDGFLCPDQVSRCQNTATCCQLSTGQWGCCPFEHATCCVDNLHCCPNGYSCNKAKEQCVRAINNDTIPWAKKKSAAVRESSSSEDAVDKSNSLTCPDRTSSCPGTASCCRTYSGTFRCCPYPNDVCCSDGQSCCPRSTICDLLNHKCISGFETEKWAMVTAFTPVSQPSKVFPAAVKVPAFVLDASIEQRTTLSPSKAGLIQCDNTHFCYDWQTCCRGASGQWGCCKYTFAQCCDGSDYCCPHGTQCSNPPGLYCY